MPDAPENFAELLADWPAIKQDIVFVRQMRKLQILLNTGTVTLVYTPGAENAVLDIREGLDADVTELLP